MSEAERGAAEGAAPGADKGGRRRSWLRYAPLAIFAVVAIVFAIQIVGGGNSDLPSTFINRPAPPSDVPPLEGLVDADGQPIPGFDNESLLGHVTVVNVFGSWCVPCRAEHPFLMALAADDRFEIFGINQQDRTADALRFLADLGNPYDAVGVDPNQRVSIDWGVYGVPETFIVDRDGIIRHKIIGQITADRLANEVMPAIEELLAEAPGGEG